MKLDEMFPRRFATGEDLAGKPVSLTIRTVSAESLHPQPGAPATTKYVVYFERAVKGVILSRTLAHQIAAALGSDDTDHWVGARVTLYPEAMTVAGQPRIAIRARKALNGESIPPLSLQDVDEE